MAPSRGLAGRDTLGKLLKLKVDGHVPFLTIHVMSRGFPVTDCVSFMKSLRAVTLMNPSRNMAKENDSKLLSMIQNDSR